MRGRGIGEGNKRTKRSEEKEVKESGIKDKIT